MLIYFTTVRIVRRYVDLGHTLKFILLSPIVALLIVEFLWVGATRRINWLVLIASSGEHDFYDFLWIVIRVTYHHEQKRRTPSNPDTSLKHAHFIDILLRLETFSMLCCVVMAH